MAFALRREPSPQKHSVNPGSMSTLEQELQLALELLQDGRPAKAAQLLEKVAAKRPPSAPVLHMLGVALAQQANWPRALDCLRHAIALDSNSAFLQADLGNILSLAGRPEEALAAFDRAVALDAGNASHHSNRANVLSALGRNDEALADYDAAIALAPDFVDALYNRALLLQKLQRLDEAGAGFSRVLSLNAEHAGAHNGLGHVRLMEGHYLSAIPHFEAAIARQPGYADAHHNLGFARYHLAQYDEALSAFRRSLAARPDSSVTRFGAACCLLASSQFAEGWPLYESRRDLASGRPDGPFQVPEWQGENCGRLLIRAEQGLGDTLQFCRYAKTVADRGIRVWLQVQPTLTALLANLDRRITVLAQDDALPAVDRQCDLLSLPRIFEWQSPLPVDRTPYLAANGGPKDILTHLPPADGRRRIGLVWNGNPHPFFAHDHRRSIPFAQFRQILTPDLMGVCLQKDISDTDRTALQSAGVTVMSDHLQDFSDTAALVDAMDLVVSIDTAVAHLAGAMGKPVWILLPHVADWRWLLDRQDSPWYPSARLFRQTANGDWSTVITAVHEALGRSH
jgi:tetratricopeptide (TPR) repeat protein